LRIRRIRRPGDLICAGQVGAGLAPNAQFCAAFTITSHHLQAAPNELGGYVRA
jgi:hypothetical protein